MTAWMLKVAMATLLLGAAALPIEWIALRRGSPIRRIWIAVAFAAPLLAWVAAIGPRWVGAPATFAATLLPFRAVDIAGAGPLIPLGGIWLFFSGLLLTTFVLTSWHARQRIGHWPVGEVEACSVRVSPDEGPAIVGWVKPIIVIPAWLRELPRIRQRLIIEHEQSHLRACDPQVIGLVLLVCVLMPWNLALWWQLLRLRKAVEIDCDARVLRGPVAVRDYGEALIDVAAHSRRTSWKLAAVSRSGSFLERRITLMSQPRRRPLSIVSAGVAALAAVLVATAIAAATADDSATAAAKRAAEAEEAGAYGGAAQGSDKQAIEAAIAEAQAKKRAAETGEANAANGGATKGASSQAMAAANAEAQAKKRAAEAREANAANGGATKGAHEQAMEAAEAEAQANKRAAEGPRADF